MKCSPQAKNIYVLLVIIAYSVISNSAVAAEIRGFPTCLAWSKTRKDGALRAMNNEFWLLGYLSGMASGLKKDFLHGTDNETIYHWVDNYCKAYSTKDADDAARALANELIEKKGL